MASKSRLDVANLVGASGSQNGNDSAPRPSRAPLGGMNSSVGRSGGGILSDSAATAVLKTIIRIHPDKTALVPFHDRDESWYDYEHCKDIIESIRETNVQQAPAIGRYVKNREDGITVEIVAGGRRRFSCKQLSRELEVEIRELTDAQAYVVMRTENAIRKSLSFAEDCLRVERAWQSNMFATQEQLAQAEGVDKSKVSRMLRVAKFVHSSFGKSGSKAFIGLGYKVCFQVVDAVADEELVAFASLFDERLKTEPSADPTAMLKKTLMAFAASKRKAAAKSRNTKVKPVSAKIGLNSSVFMHTTFIPNKSLVVEIKDGLSKVTEDEFVSAMRELYLKSKA